LRKYIILQMNKILIFKCAIVIALFPCFVLGIPVKILDFEVEPCSKNQKCKRRSSAAENAYPHYINYCLPNDKIDQLGDLGYLLSHEVKDLKRVHKHISLVVLNGEGNKQIHLFPRLQDAMPRTMTCNPKLNGVLQEDCITFTASGFKRSISLTRKDKWTASFNKLMQTGIVDYLVKWMHKKHKSFPFEQNQMTPELLEAALCFDRHCDLPVELSALLLENIMDLKQFEPKKKKWGAQSIQELCKKYTIDDLGKDTFLSVEKRTLTELGGRETYTIKNYYFLSVVSLKESDRKIRLIFIKMNQNFWESLFSTPELLATNENPSL
jgi:hypothetical protein